jgi:DNA-binding Lrp family transcriptional regulator
VDRVTIQDAARLLGISEGAVRKRVTRNTLRHDKEEDGRIYVYLDERDTRGVYVGVDHHGDALTSQLRDEIAYLREENRRKDEIIMQQAVTMRQMLPPAQEPPEAPPEPVQREEPPASTGGPENQSSRPWWRRWLGG